MDQIEESGTLEHPKKYGLLDKENNTWLGNDRGPLTYNDFDFARLVRQIIAAKIPCDPLRISVEIYTPATKKLDDLPAKYTNAEAIKRLEEGLS